MEAFVLVANVYLPFCRECPTGGVAVKRAYTAADITDTPIEDIGLLGRYPFTRGPYEREHLARNLGPNNVLILRNHGLLTCGHSIGLAVALMDYGVRRTRG